MSKTLGNNGGSFGGGSGGGLVSPSSHRMAYSESRRVQNIVPVTVREILESTEDPFKIYDEEVSTVVILGVVRRVERRTTKITLVVDDNTGSIECYQYVGTGECSGVESQMTRMEGSYGRIYGAVRNQSGSKYIVIYKVLPLQSVNEITVHALECMEGRMKLKKLKEAEALKEGGGCSVMNNTYSTVVNGGGFGVAGTLDEASGGPNIVQDRVVEASGGPNIVQDRVVEASAGHASIRDRVVEFIKSCNNDDGAERKEIESGLGMSSVQIGEVLEFLSEDGLIYTTSDDNHFKATY